MALTFGLVVNVYKVKVAANDLGQHDSFVCRERAYNLSNKANMSKLKEIGLDTSLYMLRGS